MIRGLIFDFDGLILDTEEPEYRSWQEVFEAHGCELHIEHWSAGIGKGDEQQAFSPYDHLESLLGRPIDRETIRTKRRLRHHALIAEQSVRPGVETYLADAKRLGLKLAVASSSPRSWVLGYLTEYGLHAHFDVFRCADDVQNTKPHPELYLAALDALGLQPNEAIALEDSPHGAMAAKEAGIFCVAVPNPITRQLPLDHADLRLDSLAEMPLETLIAKVEQSQR